MTARAADPASSNPFPLGRARPRPEASRNAHAFRSHSQAMAGFGAAVDDPRRPAGEHHEHSGARARNRPCGARRCFANFLSAPKGAHHQHQRGSAEGGCVLHGGPTRAERARGGSAEGGCVALLPALPARGRCP